MNPERWQEVKAVLAAALEVPPEQRAAELDSRCAGDSTLREEVEQLLREEQGMSRQFLAERALADAAAALLPEDPSPWIGRVVGAYRIVEQIGGGGMGEVYRAARDDDQFENEVALKVIRSGQESGRVISQFRNERQILASLNHPNIARLLDGGTTPEGTPYFVMELVEGQPITEYCDLHRLTVQQRLQLFSRVCEAVQYAHQRLIIHRDIKPGNILVTEDGTPKLLDFGISKVLDLDASGSSAEATLTSFRMLTPRYASPEQICGEPITTAADVYSLGVVLYELLTGQSPYFVPTGSPRELAEAIAQREATKPSLAVINLPTVRNNPAATSDAEEISAVRGASPDRLRKQLAGDLDNILMMALRKEPARRYSSVEQFREDISRHLRNLPVVARNDTVGYRTSRFVQRHKAGAIATAMVALAMLTGVAVSLHEADLARQQADLARQQAEVARIQRARAERRFNDVRKLANSLMFDIHDKIKDLPGATPARQLLVNRALEYLDSLAQEASGDAGLQRELASAYDRVGDLLGFNGAANLGNYAGAVQSYNKALAIRESAAAANPDDLQIQQDLLNNYFRLSYVLTDAGDPPGALSNLGKAEPLARRLALAHSEPRYQDLLSGIYWRKGTIQYSLAQFGDSGGSFRQAVSILEPIALDPKANPQFRTHLAADYIGLGRSLRASGDSREALDVSGKGVRILEALAASDPNNATLQEYLGEAYSLYATSLKKDRDYGRALEYFEKMRQIFGKLVSADRTDSLALDNFALAGANMGSVLTAQGNTRAAIPLIQKGISIFEKIERKNRSQVQAQADCYESMGIAYMVQNRNEESVSKRIGDLRTARSWLRKSLDMRKQLASSGSGDSQGSEVTEQSLTAQIAECDRQITKLNTR